MEDREWVEESYWWLHRIKSWLPEIANGSYVKSYDDPKKRVIGFALYCPTSGLSHVSGTSVLSIKSQSIREHLNEKDWRMFATLINSPNGRKLLATKITEGKFKFEDLKRPPPPNSIRFIEGEDNADT